MKKVLLSSIWAKLSKIVGRPSFDSIGYSLLLKKWLDNVNPFTRSYFMVSQYKLSLEMVQAIQTGKKALFLYFSKNREISLNANDARTVWFFKLNAWYVIGYCLEKVRFSWLRLVEFVSMLVDEG